MSKNRLYIFLYSGFSRGFLLSSSILSHTLLFCFRLNEIVHRVSNALLYRYNQQMKFEQPTFYQKVSKFR